MNDIFLLCKNMKVPHSARQIDSTTSSVKTYGFATFSCMGEGFGGTGFRVLWKQYERRQYRVYGKRRIANQNREGFVPYTLTNVFISARGGRT